jgi:dTDP-glucose pyrophosphorylase
MEPKVIHAIGILEETELTKDVPISVRLVMNNFQNVINEIIKTLKGSSESETEIEKMLSIYLLKIKEEYPSAIQGYIVNIAKTRDEDNNIYYELVFIEKEISK